MTLSRWGASLHPAALNSDTKVQGPARVRSGEGAVEGNQALTQGCTTHLPWASLGDEAPMLLSSAVHQLGEGEQGTCPDTTDGLWLSKIQGHNAH